MFNTYVTLHHKTNVQKFHGLFYDMAKTRCSGVSMGDFLVFMVYSEKQPFF